MRIATEQNTFITPFDKYGRVVNEQIMCYARSGYGKGLLTEGLVEWYHRNGYLIIILADPKDEIEYGYQMFEPKEKYHLEHLKLVSSLVGSWKLPGKQKVKLYHPFTFKIPTNRMLPKQTIFTIPIKSLGRSEWGMLTESHGESEAVSLLLKSANEINNEEGLYSFIHHAQASIKGKGSSKKRKADWKNFGVETPSGTFKEMRQITNNLRPFQEHYFLTKQNSPYNLDWRDILTDQTNYHVFVSNFIKDEKLSDFLVLYLFESIIRNKQYLRHPVLIVTPEISYLCPYRPEGHKLHLSNSIQRNLKTIRSMGRGMSSLSDSQVWGNVDEDLRESFTVQLYGELGGVKDVENLCKGLGWGKRIKEQLSKAEIPRTYLARGIDETDVDEGGYLFYYPRAMHCEPHYNFEEMYRKHHKENPQEYPLVSFKDMWDTIKKFYREEEQKLKDKIKRKEKEEAEQERKKKEEKESMKSESEVKENTRERVKEIQDKNKETLMRLCYERYNDANLDKKEKSYRKIADYLGIKSHKTVKKYIEEYSKKIESENSMDHEERFERMKEENKDLD